MSGVYEVRNPRPLRIAYLCADPGIPVYGCKGASIHVQEVIRALLRAGVEVDLFARRVDGPAPAGLEQVLLHSLPAAPKSRDVGARELALLDSNEQIMQTVAAAGPFDAIYERYSLWSYAGMSFAQRAGIPGLLEVNAPLIEEERTHRTLVHASEAERVARTAFAGATALLPVSEGVAEMLRGYVGEEEAQQAKIHVTPNGVDPMRFANIIPAQPFGPAAPKQFFTIGFVGTLKAWHGLETLVDAFCRLHYQNVHNSEVNYRLLIVGDGPCRADLEAQLAARGALEATHFTGAVSHDLVPTYLAAMDVAVAPYPALTDFYFSPLKLYEYMAAGLPVVASDIGQISDAVRHQETGLLYQPGDVNALVVALTQLQRDSEFAKRMGQNAQRTVQANHTWDHVAARIVHLITHSSPNDGENGDVSSEQSNEQSKKEKSRKKEEETNTKEFVNSTLPSFLRILYAFRGQIRKEWRLLLTALVTMLAGIAFRLLEPWPLKVVFDYLSDGAVQGLPAAIGTWFTTLNTNTLLIGAGLLFVVIGLTRAGTSYLNTVTLALAGNRILTRVRANLFSHLLRLPLSFHEQRRTGELLNHITGDIGRLQEVAVTAVLPLVVNILTLIGMLGVMAWMNWRLALLALVTLPISMWMMGRLSGRIRGAARQQREREGALAAGAGEALGAIRAVQTFSLEERLEASFRANDQKNLSEGVRTARLSASLERSVDVLIATCTGIVLWYGATLVQGGLLTIGDLIVFLNYLKAALRPMNDLAKYTGRIAKAVASGERVLALLEVPLTISDDRAKNPNLHPAPSLQGTVSFEKVNFAYVPERPILRDLTFQVKPGQRVAIVGPSGAGKSTITNLLLRLYHPQSGRIMIDGEEIHNYTLASLRGQIGVVLQESLLFGVSVRENIAYGLVDREASMDEIVAAARLANAHDFITSLPNGYETILGERGATLSGGQRQRIAIARAAVRQAPLVIYDEPTASLDNKNEQEVISALEKLARGRTSFWITHDLTLAERADHILYVEAGEVLEQGTHEMLMADDGFYAALYRLQDVRTLEDVIGDDSTAAQVRTNQTRPKARSVQPPSATEVAYAIAR